MYHDYRAAGRLISDDWNELYPDRLTFDHDYWQTYDQIRAAMLGLGRSAERVLAWQQLWRPGGELNFYTRLMRFLATLPGISRLRRLDTPLTRILRRLYRRPTKLEI